MINKLPTLKKSTDTQGFSKIRDWAKKELKNIQQTSRVPVCVQLPDGTHKVGKFTVTPQKNSWVADSLIFNDKRTAIFYCVLKHVGNHNEADNLKSVGDYIFKLENDAQIFQYRLSEATVKKDFFRVDIFDHRLSVVSRNLAGAKVELEKIIKHALYLSRPPVME